MSSAVVGFCLASLIKEYSASILQRDTLDFEKNYF